MRLLLQKVKHASVKVDEQIVGQIEAGYLVFLGISKDDTEETAVTAIQKLLELRILPDDTGEKYFDKSIRDHGAPLLIVSQFTLYGDLNRGRRPSFDLAASPDSARALYEYFLKTLKNSYTGQIETGIFQVHMDVSLENDGPVTFLLEL